MNRSLALAGEVLQRNDDVVVAIAPRLLGLEVAAVVYGISADQITQLQDEEDMPVLRIGRRRLVPVAATDAWIERRLGLTTESAA